MEERNKKFITKGFNNLTHYLSIIIMTNGYYIPKSKFYFLIVYKIYIKTSTVIGGVGNYRGYLFD